MRWMAAVLLVALLATAPLAVMADAGRAAPNCQTIQAASLGPTVSVDGDTCTIVDLGVLSPGDVYELSLIIVDDAIDFLFFDENSIQPYELGQSYRASMAQPASTEAAIGAYEFHWSVPPSITAKRWYMVLDNQAHDGDAGQGDQGGITSVVSAEVALLTQAYWTPFNDLVAVDSDDHTVLLSGEDLRLDAGTTVVLSAWNLEFVGDVYLQTRAMYDRYVANGVGVQYIDGGALQSVSSPQSLTWQVPSTLEGEELLLVVDNTDTPLGGGNGTQMLRMTVRLELSPPLTPTISDDGGGEVALGESIVLDASSTPNRLGQQGTFSWDLDDSVDSNSDGNAVNDNDATGLSVTASWQVPGTKTVHVVMTAPSGDSASTTHTVTVNDVTAPTARMQADGTPISNGWRVDVNNTIVLNCLASTDDDAVSGCSWTVDGEPAGNETSLSLSWSDVSLHDVSVAVSDPSGNTATATATIRSVDPSLPAFDTELFTTYPTKVTAGDSFTFKVAVEDEFDPVSALRVHWDLNPSEDADGNGDPRDDPDLVGLAQPITFDTAGDQSIVVTVFDGSNNSNAYAFVVTVEAAPTSSNSYAGVVLMVAALLVFGGASVFGYGVWQRRLAFDLLLNRGLSEEEARGHMAMIAQRTKLSPFSSAEAYAGLDQGEVVPADEREKAARQAEMDAIYGSNNDVDQTTAFAPPAYAQAPLSQASNAAAAEAAALFSDDLAPAPASTDASIDPLSALMDDAMEEPAVPGVSLPETDASPAASVALPEATGAVALPTSLTSAAEPAAQANPPAVALPSEAPPATAPPALVRHTCTACGALFEVDLPSGVNNAVVACPGCGTDQSIVSS